VVEEEYFPAGRVAAAAAAGLADFAAGSYFVADLGGGPTCGAGYDRGRMEREGKLGQWLEQKSLRIGHAFGLCSKQ
jgi:hypothetical protein